MITKYEIINPIPIRTKPYLNKRGQLVIPNIYMQHYKWYIEVARYNPIIRDKEYYVLFGYTKFDINCVKLFKDYAGNYAIELRGEFGDFINKEIATRANVDIEYMYSEDDFDVFKIE